MLRLSIKHRFRDNS